jgi:hypothetical protein
MEGAKFPADRAHKNRGHRIERILWALCPQALRLERALQRVSGEAGMMDFISPGWSARILDATLHPFKHLPREVRLKMAERAILKEKLRRAKILKQHRMAEL